MPCDLGLTRPRTRILLGVSSVGECKASHASLCRSSAFNDPDIMPCDSSPESKLTSVPLILGEPSRRRVASVLCFRTVKRSRALRERRLGRRELAPRGHYTQTRSPAMAGALSPGGYFPLNPVDAIPPGTATDDQHVHVGFLLTSSLPRCRPLPRD
jgi:hypothetical protein